MAAKHIQDSYEIILATDNSLRFRNNSLLRRVKECKILSMSSRNELMRHIEELRTQFTTAGYPADAPLEVENEMINQLLILAEQK